MSTARCLRTAAAFAALACLPLAGCIKMNQSNVLNQDGTGTMTMIMSMDKAKMKEMEDMAKAFGGEGAGGDGEMGGMMDEMNPEELKKELAGKEGIEVVSAEKIDDEKNVGAKVVLKYKSLEHLYKANVGGMGKGGMKVTLEEKAGAWLLTQESGDDSMGGMSDMGGEEMPEMMKAMFAGLDLSFSLTVPGTILETNGAKNEAGNTVTWKMTEKELGNKDAMKALSKMTVSFKGDALALKAFTLVTSEDDDAEGEEADEKEEAEAPVK